MVKRKRVGFLFSYNENWIAGTYYILNIINALNTVSEDLKPTAVIITDKKENFEIVRDITQYPYLKRIILKDKLTFFQRSVNKVTRVFGKSFYTINLNKPKIDLLYPNKHPKVKIKNLKKISWIPDFQEEFLPHFFSDNEISIRKKNQKKISNNEGIVVFSSDDAKKHFEKLYPKHNVEKFVLHFAVTLPDFSRIDKKLVFKKHKLPQKYYFSPNQFWAHKNHIIILKAVKLLKEKGIEVFVAFSGKDHDYRNKEYVESLKKFIKKNNIDKNVSFLGFLDRKEQLFILNSSIAVIQPSLFEGWSTVVEDSKALNKHIILSDLEVHKEQIKINCDFFERENILQLSNLLEKYSINSPVNHLNEDYKNNINKFGKDFLELIEKAT